jgi:hypothetical protein
MYIGPGGVQISPYDAAQIINPYLETALAGISAPTPMQFAAPTSTLPALPYTPPPAPVPVAGNPASWVIGG